MTEAPNPNKIAGYQNLVNIFDGEFFSNIQYFLHNLEDVGALAQLNDAELIAVLRSKLKGPALQFFIDDSVLLKETKFQNIKAHLVKKFENKTTLSHRQQQFSNCRQNPGESVRSYSTRVSNLTTNYFGVENTSKKDAGPIVDQTKLAKFLEGLQPPIKRLVLTRNPTTFDGAVELALLDELNSQLTCNNGETPNASSDTPQPINTLENKLTEFLAEQAKVSNQVIGALADNLQKINIHKSTPRRNQRQFLNQWQTCTICGRNNHNVSQCFFMNAPRGRNPHFYNRTSHPRTFPHTSYPSHASSPAAGSNSRFPQASDVLAIDFSIQNMPNTAPRQNFPLNYRGGR